jgi:SAM-dependent methyltransferase
MTTYAGVMRIVRFNWPWYAAALAATGLFLIVWVWWIPPGPLRVAAIAALVVGNGWLVMSLIVSHLVYDRSSLARGGWLEGQRAVEVAILHAGLDEASGHAARLLPGARLRAFDIRIPSLGVSPSLRRARAYGGLPLSAQVVSSERLPLPDASIDLALVVFAAHELRDDRIRIMLFRELARIVGPNGRILVVEHLRDVWNLLAYGPGFLHFLSRRTFMRTFAEAGLRLHRDDTYTPWVHAFELRTAP